MSGRRAICVSRDHGVCRVVDAALTAAGLDVTHLAALPRPGAEAAGELVLIVADREARQAFGGALGELAVPVVVVGEDLEDEGLITLMLEAPISHVVRDPSDHDLRITSAKLVSGDMFGLEKYLTGAPKVGERVVRSDLDKRNTIREVSAWAESVGARAPVVHRVRSVVDELLMNALRDTLGDDRRATVRWASDASFLAISVGDAYGALRQRDLIDHVVRARLERGRPEPASEAGIGGAGLGLYLVLSNVASLIVNLDAGHRTEVVCLFDLRNQRATATGARSLHVFHAPN